MRKYIIHIFFSRIGKFYSRIALSEILQIFQIVKFNQQNKSSHNFKSHIFYIFLYGREMIFMNKNFGEKVLGITGAYLLTDLVFQIGKGFAILYGPFIFAQNLHVPL